jgi:hypothetical protein
VASASLLDAATRRLSNVKQSSPDQHEERHNVGAGAVQAEFKRLSIHHSSVYCQSSNLTGSLYDLQHLIHANSCQPIPANSCQLVNRRWHMTTSAKVYQCLPTHDNSMRMSHWHMTTTIGINEWLPARRILMVQRFENFGTLWQQLQPL